MAILLATLLAALQAPAPPQAVATPASGEIIVQGRRYTRRDVNASIEAVAEPQGVGGFVSQYARWTRSPCVSVAGLPQDGGHLVADRIGALARRIGIGAGGPGCSPNVFVIFTREPRALITQLRTKSPALVSGLAPVQLTAIADSQDPVRWITATEVSSSQGDPIQVAAISVGSYALNVLPIWSASNIEASTRTFMTRMTIVVDGNQLDGINYAQISAYVAMIALAQFRTVGHVPSIASILSLFPRGGTAPDDLTEFDMAYLEALYSTDAGLPAGLQRMDMVDLIRHRLAADASKR